MSMGDQSIGFIGLRVSLSVDHGLSLLDVVWRGDG